MSVQWWALGVSILSAIIAGVSVRYGVLQAHASQQQASSSRKQVETAKEQVDAAYEQARAAREQVAISEEARRDAAQPYVYADIRPDPRSGVLIMLVIENTGPTVAHNVQVTFDPPLESTTFSEIAATPALANGLRAMPPGRRQEWYFDSALKRYKEDCELPRQYHVTVRADGPFGAVEPLEYDLDLNSFLDMEERGTGGPERCGQRTQERK